MPRQPDAQGDPLAAARRGFEFYKRIQSPSGHWACEYGGPQFLLPGILITGYITGTTLPDEWRIEMSRYLFNIQRSNGVGDGGWGLSVSLSPLYLQLELIGGLGTSKAYRQSWGRLSTMSRCVSSASMLSIR